MQDLIKAIRILHDYNDRPFDQFADIMEMYYGIKISKDERDAWKFTGLNNVDFFKSRL